MNHIDKDHSVIIIGAGFAGLAAGIYAQMNGYNSRIFEMHDKPGGLCTAWKRKGYTIDGCIHWLVGSSPDSAIYDMWQEVGIVPKSRFIDMEEFTRFVDKDGNTLIFYCDVNKLEKHLLAYAPEDEKQIRKFTNGIRLCLNFDVPSNKAPMIRRVGKGLKILTDFALKGRTLKRLMKTTAGEFASRFKNPFLRHALQEVWIPEFSVLFMMFSFAFMHNKNAGYPHGGSLPLADAMASRYTNLGGSINYTSKAEKILVKSKKAIGVRLSDGSEHYCDRVISAADGHTTIFKMLKGKFGDYRTSDPYENWTPFSPLIYIGLGVADDFRHWPHSVSGTMMELKSSIEIAGKERAWLNIHPYHYDPSLAPAGKTSVVIMMPTTYKYWKDLYKNPDLYKKEKQEIADKIVVAIEEILPTLSGKVEMVDVATPMTFERYTGNWKGSFEGWLITPENAWTILKKMPQTIDGLSNFYMCGQWVEPGGGLPTSVMSAKRLIKKICKQDRKKFVIHKQMDTNQSYHEIQQRPIS